MTRIKQEKPKNIVLCSVVLAELFYGARHSGPAHRAKNLLGVEQFRHRYASIPFDDSAAEEYGLIRAHLESIGMPIGPNNLMIAAIAKAGRLILVTNNTAEFSRVPDLALEDWQNP